MLKLKRILVQLACWLAIPGVAFAQDAGFFVGIDTIGSVGYGTPTTTTAGAYAGGGGSLSDIRFGAAVNLGGHVGYRFDGPLSVSISYQHLASSIAWTTHFKANNDVTFMEGNAQSDVVLVNLGLDLLSSETTTIGASLGLGFAHNQLFEITETTQAPGGFGADINPGQSTGLAAQIGLSLTQKLTDNAVLALGGSFGYSGEFETADSRTTHTGSIHKISPYTFEAWRASFSGSLRFQF